MTFYISLCISCISCNVFHLIYFVHGFVLFSSIVHCKCESNLCNLNMIVFTYTAGVFPATARPLIG